MNKQDYAHLHGLEVHLSAQNVDDKATVRNMRRSLCPVPEWRRCSWDMWLAMAFVCPGNSIGMTIMQKEVRDRQRASVLSSGPLQQAGMDPAAAD